MGIIALLLRREDLLFIPTHSKNLAVVLIESFIFSQFFLISSTLSLLKFLTLYLISFSIKTKEVCELPRAKAHSVFEAKN